MPINDVRDSRQKLANILDSIAEGIYCIDLKGNCTFCNHRCIQLLGYESIGQLLGQNMHALIHHKHRSGQPYPVEHCKIFAAYHNDQRIHVDDEVFWRKDGTGFDAEYWSYPMKVGDNIVGAVVSFLDITVKREETSYRNQLARLVESSCDAIISKNLDGVIRSWNSGASEIYGYDADEAIGNTIELILPDGQVDEEQKILQSIREGFDLREFETKRKTSLGEVVDVSITVSPLYNTDNQLMGSSSIERDITERRRSIDEILKAKAVAEHAERLANAANRSRAEFLANVSHELRTPMNAILGMLQLTLDEPLDPTILEYLNVAKSSADSLLALVNELLDFAKIESGKFDITLAPFDLRETIDMAGKALAPAANDKGLEVLCEIESSIPTILIGDGRRIQQIITNLLSNAVKFTEHGEIVIRVTQLRKMPQEVRLRFSVTDTGIGIAPQNQQRVFSPFAQADKSSTRQNQGTGLGLSICRELVSLMGGKLKLKSEVRKGSNFFFELTLHTHSDEKPSDLIPIDLVGDLKVLIVDDNPTNLQILKKIFESWSMLPLLAENADVAIEILNECRRVDSKVSMAVVDGMMPVVDGFDLAKKIAEISGDQSLPVVIMQSSTDLMRFSEKRNEAPVVGYLRKPVSQSELLDTVVDTLDLYSRPTYRPQPSNVISALKKPLSILLVEDLAANQLVAKAILEKRGHHVTIASNGREAVEAMKSNGEKIDLILMDVQMPIMDGFQATSIIRELPDAGISKCPIVAMTAHAMQGDREHCLASGMDAYIAKPLDAKQLVELAEAIVLSLDQVDYVHTESETVETTSSLKAPSKQFEFLELDVALKRLGGDQELFEELVDIFMEDTPELMQKIADGITHSDGKGVEHAAHALKGLMTNFGAKACVDLTQRFEIAGRNGEPQSVSDELPTLIKLYQQLRNELAGFQ